MLPYLYSMNPIEQLKSKIDAADLWHKEIELTRGAYLKVGGSTDTNLYYVVKGSLRIFFDAIGLLNLK